MLPTKPKYQDLESFNILDDEGEDEILSTSPMRRNRRGRLPFRPIKFGRKEIVWSLLILLGIILLSVSISSSNDSSQNKVQDPFKEEKPLVPITSIKISHTTQPLPTSTLNALPTKTVLTEPSISFKYQYFKNISQLNTVSVKDLQSNAFQAKKPSFQFITSQSMPDGSYLVYNQNGDLILKHINDYSTSQKGKVLCLKENMKRTDGSLFNPESVSISSDGKMILFETDAKKRWRNSQYSNYYIYNTETEQMTPLFSLEQLREKDLVLEKNDDSMNILYAEWSPKENLILFGRKGDLYLWKNGEISRLTFDGENAQIFNGVSDWVYEEEVLSDVKAFYFSPDGKFVAYYKFNDTLVREYEMPIYNVEVENGGQFSTMERFKYPKPGTPNPSVGIYLLSIESGESVPLNLTDSADEDFIIDRVFFSQTGSDLIVSKMNRFQDQRQLIRFTDYSSMKPTTVIFRTEKIDNGWLERQNEFTFVNETDAYIDLIAIDNSMHLAYFSQLFDDQPFNILTKGSFEVTDVLGFHQSSQSVFFLSTQNDATERHLYSYSFTTNQVKEWSIEEGKEAFYNVLASPNLDWIILYNDGPGIPSTAILNVVSGEITVIEDNSALKEKLGQITLPKVEYLKLPIRTNQVKNPWLNAKLIYPINYQPSLLNFYPLLVTGYWGPNSQRVQKRLQIDLNYLLSSQFHFGNDLLDSIANHTWSEDRAQPPFFVLIVDTRGTGCMGLDYRFAITKQLGILQSLDLISITRDLLQKFQQINQQQVSIYGWSFGGFMASKVVEMDESHVFKYSVAVAPVTKWEFYDSIYTERYMKQYTPDSVDYHTTSISNMTNFGLINKFTVIHGTADDNVHIGNTLYLLNQLQKSKVPVERWQSVIVPGDDHAMSRTEGAYWMVMARLYQSLYFMNENEK